MKIGKKFFHSLKQDLLHYRILFALGGVFIFGSWVIQNFQENKFRGERERIQKMQDNVIHMMDARRVWLESVFTHASLKPDIKQDSVYHIKIYDYIETSLNVVALMDEIIIKDTVKLDSIKKDLAETIVLCANYCKGKDYDKLVQVSNAINMQDKYNLNGKFLDSGSKIKQLLDDLTAKENEYNHIYLYLYVIGAFCLAADFSLRLTKREREADASPQSE
jgi:hypothetical protein